MEDVSILHSRLKEPEKLFKKNTWGQIKGTTETHQTTWDQIKGVQALHTA